MTSLYNCRHSGDQYRISKFSSHFDLEASYLVDATACECPAGHRSTCRHREMLPKFINRGHIGDEWFFDHDRGGWVQGEALLNELASAASTPPSTDIDEDEVEIYEPSASYADGRWPINAGVDAKDVTPKRSPATSAEGGPIPSPSEPAATADEAAEAMNNCDYWNGRKSLSDSAPSEATPLDTKPKASAIPTIRRRV